jgi:hypothetical protein
MMRTGWNRLDRTLRNSIHHTRAPSVAQADAAMATATARTAVYRFMVCLLYRGMEASFSTPYLSRAKFPASPVTGCGRPRHQSTLQAWPQCLQVTLYTLTVLLVDRAEASDEGELSTT